MKLAINVALSVAMLGVCLWLVWPDETSSAALWATIDQLELAELWPYLVGYIALLAVTHFTRAWRWNDLLGPLDVRIPGAPLLAISSVGFMAIMALPARLGEFVRPALVRQKGYISASAALGTVAVERILDGLLVSVVVLVTAIVQHDATSPDWMLPTACIALGGFGLLGGFLLVAMKWPLPAIRFALRVSLIARFAPKLATVLERKLLDLIRGFDVLKHRRYLFRFMTWTVIMWFAYALSIWLLAIGFGLELTLFGAVGTTALLAIGISLPNSPGMVAQYQWMTMIGLSLYLAPEAAEKGTPLFGTALAFAIVLHTLQVLWYFGVGTASLATRYVSLSDLRRARREL